VNRSRYPPWPALLAMLRDHPLRTEAVETILAECEPEDGMELFGGGVCWLRVVAGDDEEPHPRACLPPALFDRLPVGERDDPQSAVRHFPTENAAYKALAEACDDYASGRRGKP
jgi:hypothetical protein